MRSFRVIVENYGCSANQADGEVLAGCLRQAGFILADNLQSADVIIFNCCAVKGPTENRMIAAVKRAPLGKKVIVAGCLPIISFERLTRETQFDGVVGPALGRGIVDVVNRVCAGEKVVELNNSFAAKPGLCLPRKWSNPVVSVVPVSYGCLGSCTYCCVLFARGHLRSYPIAEVLERFRSDLVAGAREFWITSQDTACYGRDVGVSLPKLLKGVCVLPGEFKIRVGMMTPNHVSEMLDELIDAFKDVKIFKFIHLPLQSGDDEVLKQMRRFYTSQEFKRIVEAFKAAFPEITLATDVICGFPGEKDEAFENTLKLISEIKPDVVNISKFFARPGTMAAKITEGLVDKAEIKHRSAKMTTLTKQVGLDRNRGWLGWTGEILIDEKGKISGSWIGRNFAYKPIVVKSSLNLLGQTLQIKVVETFQTHLLGEIAK